MSQPGQNMKAAQFLSPHTDLQIVTISVPQITDDEVLIKVDACGVCHGDIVAQEGHFPGLTYPRTPGHEIIGTLVKLGKNVPQSHLKENDTVGVGWHDQHCFKCDSCIKGEHETCKGSKGIPTATGLSRDGGYAEYVSAKWEAVVRIPSEYENKKAEAAPLLCAGLTVFNSLRNSDIRPGEVVLVQGVGGLGHLAIQYAVRMGCYTVALTTSQDKAQLAKNLGAKEAIIVQKDGSHLSRIRELGGAKVVLATAPDSAMISSIIPFLAPYGSVMILAVPHEPLSVNAMPMIMNRTKLVGWASGLPKDAEDTLKFSSLVNILPQIQTFPLEKANEAFNSMKNNTVRFRAVILP